jgi:hypothetical protein
MSRGSSTTDTSDIDDRRVLVFTMVKDEAALLPDWIHYYGHLFGYDSIHIVDNFSTDGSWEIISEMQTTHGVHGRQEADYQKKGEFMKAWMLARSTQKTDILYPIDVDEFIVLFNYSENTIQASRSAILGAMHELPVNQPYVFKQDYLGVVRETASLKDGVRDEESHAELYNYAGAAKTFLNAAALPSCTFDHGNHGIQGPSVEQSYLLTIRIVHWFVRTPEQMVTKVLNNWKGLGYTAESAEAVQNTDAALGVHYKGMVYQILKNKTAFYESVLADVQKPSDRAVSLGPLARAMKQLRAGELGTKAPLKKIVLHEP